jgi:hypothetical protein
MVPVDSIEIPRGSIYSGTPRETARCRIRDCHPLWCNFPKASANGQFCNSHVRGPTTPQPASAVVRGAPRKFDAPFHACVYRRPPSSRTLAPPHILRVAWRLRNPGLFRGEPLPTPPGPLDAAQLALAAGPVYGARDPFECPAEGSASTPYLATMSGTCNSFCKVLFILRSHYLCAIGLRPVFSLGRDIPATSRCSPNQHYSVRGWQPNPGRGRNGGFTLLAGLSRELRPRLIVRTARPETLQLVNRRADDSALSSSPLARRYDGNRSCCLFLG